MHFLNWWKLHFQQNTAAGMICRLHRNSTECQAELTSDHSAQREPEGRCRPASWRWGARPRQEATGEGSLNTQPNPVPALSHSREDACAHGIKRQTTCAESSALLWQKKRWVSASYKPCEGQYSSSHLTGNSRKYWLMKHPLIQRLGT